MVNNGQYIEWLHLNVDWRPYRLIESISVVLRNLQFDFSFSGCILSLAIADVSLVGVKCIKIFHMADAQ